MINIPLNLKKSLNKRITNFDELVTATRTSSLNLKPTWGISNLRYDTTTTGTGASVGEINGEFIMQTGTDTGSEVRIQSKRVGQYQAGTQGEFGAGVRFDAQPTSTAYWEWGYYDGENGFGFGYDATEPYVYSITGGGPANKIYQSNWNIDTLLGLDMTAGNIFQIDFVWYGYGDIKFYIVQTRGNTETRILVHRIIVNGSVSIIDPNQPLRFYGSNGISNTTNSIMYVGGHQYAVIDGFSVPQLRPVTSLISQYTTVKDEFWQPIMSVRKKALFNGRRNSVNVIVTGYDISATGNLETKLTVNGAVSGGSWTTPVDWPASETAVEVATATSGIPLTTSANGYPIEYKFVTASKNDASTSFRDREIVPLGEDTEIILWVRRYNSVDTIDVLSADIEWNEEW